MTDLIGFLAACLTTLSFVPQAFLVIRTGQTEGISITMYAMFTLGIAFWFAYGLLRMDMPMIVANAITLSLASVIIFMKVRAMIAKRRLLRTLAETPADPA